MPRDRINAFRFAFEGLAYLLRTQPHARIHLAMTVAVVAAGWWLHVSALAWAALVLAMGAVWAAEAFNTAVEAVVDLTTPRFHPLAKAAKDVAAAGVLLAAMAAAVVGLLVFLPPLLARLKGG